MENLKFVLCINNKNCDDLTLLKVYQILIDESAYKDNYLRLIDDSGEDYLYPASYFVSVELPEEAKSLFVEIRA